MCADTTVHEEEDPSDGKSDYAFDQNALPSDLSTGINLSTGIDTTDQDELALLSGFNITYNKRDSPLSLSSTIDSVEPSNQSQHTTYKLSISKKLP